MQGDCWDCFGPRVVNSVEVDEVARPGIDHQRFILRSEGARDVEQVTPGFQLGNDPAETAVEIAKNNACPAHGCGEIRSRSLPSAASGVP